MFLGVSQRWSNKLIQCLGEQYFPSYSLKIRKGTIEMDQRTNLCTAPAQINQGGICHNALWTAANVLSASRQVSCVCGRSQGRETRWSHSLKVPDKASIIQPSSQHQTDFHDKSKRWSTSLCLLVSNNSKWTIGKLTILRAGQLSFVAKPF